MAESLNFLNTALEAFMLGTFPVRPFLLLGYAALVAITWLVWNRYGRGQFREKLIKRMRLAVICALALVYLCALCSQVYVFHSYGIAGKGYAIFFTGDEITSTRLAHDHFGKVVIATALAPWSKDIVPVADSGEALTPYLPKGVAWIMFALFTIATLGSLVLTPSVVRRANGPWRRVAIGALYIAISFIALAKSLDGGIVSDSAGIALGMYTVLLYAPKHFYKALMVSTAAYAAVLTLLYVGGYYWPQHFFFETLVRSALFAALLALLCYLAFARATKHMMFISSAATLVLFICIGIFVHRIGETNRDYLARPIESGKDWLAAYPSEAQPALPRIGSVGRLVLYNADEFAGAPTFYALDSYHLPYWYMPISQFPNTCFPATVLSGEEFSLVSRKPLVSTVFAGGIVTLDLTPAVAARSGWYAYQARITQNGCTPRYADVMQQAIHAAGSDQAIVYNLTLFTVPASDSRAQANGDKKEADTVPVF